MIKTTQTLPPLDDALRDEMRINRIIDRIESCEYDQFIDSMMHHRTEIIATDLLEMTIHNATMHDAHYEQAIKSIANAIDARIKEVFED